MAKSAALPTANQLPQRSRRLRTLTSFRRDAALSSATAGEASRWSPADTRLYVMWHSGECARGGQSGQAANSFAPRVEPHQLPVEAAHLLHRGPQAVAG